MRGGARVAPPHAPPPPPPPCTPHNTLPQVYVDQAAKDKKRYESEK